MREKWLWTNATVALLGLWLISSPFTFGYTRPALLLSDVLSGTLLTVCSVLAFWPRWDFVGRWTVALVGIWLQAAPLFFWAPDAAAYLNDTLVGALAITLSILVPTMPGMAHHMEMMKPGPEIAPGWSYNPSTWHQRAPMIVLGFVGWMISRYLAAFQLGYIETVWDPFFGSGTRQVLTSEVSRMFPISDAGLGALAYTVEFLMAWMGGRTRWRSMPWMVTFFFIVIVPLGLTHIILVILQPVAVGEWCTLCLAAAFMMLIMIPFTVDEVIVTGQFLAAARRNGKSLWRTFWVGGTLEGGSDDTRTPRYGAPVRPLSEAVTWGVTPPWTLVASAIAGVWVMFSPVLLGSEVPAAHSDQVAGALVVTVAVISTAEVVRAFRFVNVLLGAWILASGWMLSGASAAAQWNGLVAGLLILALSLPRGHIRERYGAWQSWIV
ncbi:MAG: vitamin K epoxide reductase family protein [Cyanobacteria bacterium]|nr:vitamin K epoxide reductase family protein [Cyanobacteriota bacterium]